MTTVSATQMEWGLVEKLRRSFRFKSSYVYTCRSRRLPGEEGLQKGGGGGREREREEKKGGGGERVTEREGKKASCLSVHFPPPFVFRTYYSGRHNFWQEKLAKL